jgi:hypothetical protein
MFCILTACEQNVTEIKRTPNTDGSIDAVIAIKETGATVATPTEIYLVSHGQKIQGQPVFRADNVEKLALIWDNAIELRIRAKVARVFLNEKSTQITTGAKPTQSITIKLDIDDLR